ncbi:hypothetical protein QTP88_028665 [Uroleucon formosanum]
MRIVKMMNIIRNGRRIEKVISRTGFGAPIIRARARARTGTGSVGGQPPNLEGEPRTAPIGPRHASRPDWSRRPARAGAGYTHTVAGAEHLSAAPCDMPGARPPQPPP